jgi:tRNA threonylcarbamoyladenosine biosynthesis protein TsaB
MKLLAIDTATEACSAALTIDGVVTSREALVGRGHAERILPMVDELLAAAGLSLGALDAIAFGRGPGAFTGVRIAVSVAQGLAFGAGLAAVPISDLAALGARALGRAQQEWGVAAEGREALVCLDARMGEVYYGRVRPCARLGVELLEEGLAPPAAAFAAPLEAGVGRVGAGHGFSAYPALGERLGAQLRAVWPELLPRAVEIAALGALALAAGLAVPAEAAAPVYLRDQVASQSGRPRAQ